MLSIQQSSGMLGRHSPFRLGRLLGSRLDCGAREQHFRRRTNALSTLRDYIVRWCRTRAVNLMLPGSGGDPTDCGSGTLQRYNRTT
jgi:hypothetical protein